MTDQNDDSARSQFHKEKREYALRTLPEHRRLAGRWDELFALLTNFKYIEDKIALLSTNELELDYQFSLRKWGGSNESHNILKSFSNALRLNSHLINENPGLTFTYFYNFLTWLDAPNGPIHALCEQEARRQVNWLCLTQNPEKITKDPENTISRHSNWIRSLAFTKDGRYIISNSLDGTVRVWGSNDKQLVSTIFLDKHEISVLTPNDKFIITSHLNGQIMIWELDTGTLFRTIETNSYITEILVTPDGRKIITGHKDTFIRIWDFEGRLFRSIHNIGDIEALEISPNGKILYSGSNQGIINCWIIETGENIGTLKDDNSRKILKLVMTKDGKKIISSCDQFIKIWEVTSGKVLNILELPEDCLGNGAFVSIKIALSIDDKYLISGQANGCIQIWDLSEGKQKGQIQLKIKNADIAALAIAPTSGYFIATNKHHAPIVEAWDILTGNFLWSMDISLHGVNSISVSSDGDRIITGHNAEIIKVWDLQSRKLLKSFFGETGFYEINSIDISQSGKYIISSRGLLGLKKSIDIWDYESEKIILSIGDKGYRAIISPDEKCIIYASESTIKVMDLRDRKILHILSGHRGEITALLISQNGKICVSGSADGTMRIWNPKNGRLTHILRGHLGPVIDVDISNDGKKIVSISDDLTLKIWERTFIGWKHRSINIKVPASTVKFNKDEKEIILGLSDQTIKIWNFYTGKLSGVLIGHKSKVTAMTVSQKHNYIISGSADHTLKFWKFPEDRLKNTDSTHSFGVSAICISPNGMYVVSGDENNSIMVRTINGEVLYTLKDHDHEYSDSGAYNLWQIYGIEGLMMSSDSNFLVSVSADKKILLRDIKNGAVLLTLLVPTEEIPVAVYLSKDMRKIISLSRNEKILVWDVKKKHILQSFECSANSFAVSEDEKYLVFSSYDDKSINIIDYHTGHTISSFKFSVGFSKLIISKDNQLIIAVSNQDFSIALIDFATGKLVNKLSGHTDYIQSLFLCNRDKNIISGSLDKTIRYWNVENGSNTILFKNDVAINRLSLSMDEDVLVFGDSSGAVKIANWIH